MFRVQIEDDYKDRKKPKFTVTLGPFEVEGRSLMECFAKLDEDIRKDFDAAAERGYGYKVDTNNYGSRTSPWVERYGRY